jgi:hypothetical protein
MQAPDAIAAKARKPWRIGTIRSYSCRDSSWKALAGRCEAENSRTGNSVRMSVDGLYDDQPAGGQLDWPHHGVSVEEPARIDEKFNEPEQGRESGPERSQGSEPAVSKPSSDRHEPPENTDSAQSPEDAGWSWKGLELSPHANRVAEAGLEQRRTAEGRDADGNYTDRGITPAMRRLEADLEHGSLVPDTEKFALKSPDRFKEKLAKMMVNEPDISPSEACSSIHDGIRYTFLFAADRYSAGLKDACGKLEEGGYEALVLKNTWRSEEYKGINSRWRDAATGVVFEVQFHTQASWEVKQQTHDAYEAVNDPRTPVGQKERLRAFQREINQRVKVPEGASDIEEYRREGW